MAVQYENIQQRRLPTDGYYSESNDSEKESLIPGVKTGYKEGGGVKCFVYILAAISAIGGFLFGYDTGVVSGAMIKVRVKFDLDSTMQEAIVSATIGAAAVAAAAAGPLTDGIGRRPTLIISSAVFTIGAAVMGAAWTPWILLIGRIIVGFGIGIAAMAVPMYIAELAPADMRGKLVVVNNMFITGGQFIATVIDGAFSYLGLNVGWRFMLGLAGLPSLIMFFGFLFMPESPRWLVFRGKVEKARGVLGKVRQPHEVEEELKTIIEDREDHKKSQRSCGEFLRRFLTSRPVLLALLVGCGLQMFQQFSGINTVMYYSASIIQMAGFSDQDSIWLATVPAAANFVFTIVGLLLVERLGRRKLLLGSVSGTIFGFVLLSATFVLMDYNTPSANPLIVDECRYYSCSACVGNSKCGFCVEYNPVMKDYLNGTCSLGTEHHDGTTSSNYHPAGSNLTCAILGDTLSNETDSSFELANFIQDVRGENSTNDRQWYFKGCPDNRFASLAIVALFLYIAFFAPGMGPLPWTINSEIYPTWARSTAIAIATFVNWCANLIISMTFLTLADTLGQPLTFGLYASLSFLALVFFVFLVPETRGRKLEDVEELFQRPYCVSWCRSDYKERERQKVSHSN